MLKDLKDIDMSLRTVATQLLNVTNHESVTDNSPSLATKNEKLVKSEAADGKANVESSTEAESTVADTTALIYGRPINSKFSYFGSGHPGEAMALTEEEIERELNFTKVPSTQANEPTITTTTTTTTTGGISTWILLNPPSTSMKNLFQNTSNLDETKEANIATTTTTTTKKSPLAEATSVNVTSYINKVVDTSTPDIKATEVKNSGEIQVKVNAKKPPPVATKNATDASKVTLTPSPNKGTLLLATSTVRNVEREPLVTTLKPVSTTKKRVATTAAMIKQQHSSLSKNASMSSGASNKGPGQASKPKNPSKRVTVKPNVNKTEQQYTSKIEKVTLKPVQLASTEKVSLDANEPVPFFVAKLKGTINTAPKKHANNTNVNFNKLQETKLKVVDGHRSNISIAADKKRVNESVSEIKPTNANKVVTTMVKIEKVSATPLTTETTSAWSEPPSRLSTTTPITTTKRPRHTSKRKKNKLRRRKPTGATTVQTISPNAIDQPTVNNNNLLALQESKIEPEAKLPSANNSTKNKPSNKNPISTQIYNFLSREIMPSFGVMSLVGLGLGLASYFLYPFGGAITRRNYALEPNYKYNLDEYGGNNGQNEEDILKQVFQGMTNYDNNRYNNYYPYAAYKDTTSDSSKKNNGRYSNASDSKLRVADDSSVKINYRNLDYKYHDLNRSPQVDESSRNSNPVAISGIGNGQFVVGSVLQDRVSIDNPKDDVNPSVTEKSPLVYEEGSHYYDYPKYVNNEMESAYDGANNVSNKSDDDYDKFEASSTVVAVEHGPRALKIKRSIDDQSDKPSVIQVIPPKTEEEDKEDLSNEILDIIDSVIPHSNDHETKDKNKLNKKKQEIKSDEATTKLSAASTKVEVTTSIGVLSNGTTHADIAKDKNGKTSTTIKTTKKSSDEKITQQVTKSIETTTPWKHSFNTTQKPTTAPEPTEKFNVFNFMRNVAEVKFRLGLTLLKHASEGFARYISHVQKRLNGET